jgi:hypothetical protein
VLIDEAKGAAGNPWGVLFHTRIWHMAENSAWFRTAAQLGAAGLVRDGGDWVGEERYVPLYEAKMIHQSDHRWATYDGTSSRDVTAAEKADPGFEPAPRYWVPELEVRDRLAAMGWTRRWLLGWRDITNATNERTVIVATFPRVAVGHTAPLLFPNAPPALSAALLASLASLTVDYIARQKIGGTHVTYGYLAQFPILPPSTSSGANLAFIVPRVLELTYTSLSMAPFARDLGYNGPPFAWNEDRRALLRAELDAWYARAYGLTRDELLYILDPLDVMGPDYPSETFRVLKNNEKARYGEFRTARLMLAAWDAQAAQLAAAQ